MKNFLKLTVVLLVFILLGLWSPWNLVNFNFARLFGVEEAKSISGLQVYSTKGEVEVFLDNKSQGTTSSAEEPVIVDTVDPGERLVTIKRKSDTEGAYFQLNKLIDFVPGVDVVISYLIGPDETFSEGSIISARKKQGESFNLEVSTNISNFNITLDGVEYISKEDRFTGNITFDTQHKLKIEKSGYESMELTLLPKDQESRDRLSNYIIQIDLNLMLQPVTVE